MTNSYRPDEGEIMVPFDLRRDVLEPLRGLVAKVEELAASVRAHVEGHDDRLEAALERWDQHRRAERRRRLLSWAKRAATAAGGLLVPILGILAGRSH